MAIRPRKVVGDAKRWKALSHPLRQDMLRHIAEHGPATSTTLAEALGENTGTTSYHLRVLADAGVIEEVPERASGRERWWRTFPVDHREPDYDTLGAGRMARPADPGRARVGQPLRPGRPPARPVGQGLPGPRFLHRRGPGVPARRVRRAAAQVRALRAGRAARGPAHAAADVLHPRRIAARPAGH